MQHGGVQKAPERSLVGMRLLEGLEERERLKLESHCRWRWYEPGERIFSRGDESREVYFVAEGAVNIVDFSLSGREVAFWSAGAGESFGELAAIDAKPRSASVITHEKTLVAILQAAPFRELLQQRVEITFNVLSRLAEIIRVGDERIMELSSLAATHRVYAELLRMAKPDAAVPGLWVVRPLPPLREIASRVSTTRETVARALSQLYPTDLLRRKGRNLYLMDRDALQEIIYALEWDGRQQVHHH